MEKEEVPGIQLVNLKNEKLPPLVDALRTCTHKIEAYKIEEILAKAA